MKPKQNLLNIIKTMSSKKYRETLIKTVFPKTPPRLYLSCDCCCSVITMERDEEFDQFYISMFKYSFADKLSWKERFRWIKEILLTGNIWTDNVVLNKQEFNKLKRFVNKY